MKVSLLTAGKDPHYALGLLSGLRGKKVDIDFIGNDEMRPFVAEDDGHVQYHNLRGDQDASSSLHRKMVRVAAYYWKLIQYSAKTDSKLFHILWLNKFVHFDMTVLNVYYKLMGKKILYTAHNINIAERDDCDSWMNRICLSFLYRIVDHIFVHTEKMREQLEIQFRVDPKKVTIIPFGINNIMPETELTSAEAKQRLGLSGQDKTLLFFGNIAPYKGLEYLVASLPGVQKDLAPCKLLIAGSVKSSVSYWNQIQEAIEKNNLQDVVIQKIEYIPDSEVELYFKAADLLVLPYKNIFQSGVLFLAYKFGLPVLCTDVGSLKEYIVEGKTGSVCGKPDPDLLSEKIVQFFQSSMYSDLDATRETIRDYANQEFSWKKIAELTCQLYERLLP